MKSPLSLNTGTVDILLVDLPEDAQDFQLFNGNHNTFLLYRPSKAQGFLPRNRQKIEIPFGDYKIIGWSDSLTEEQAKGLVEKDQRGYKHYWKDNGFVPRGFNHRYKAALESFRSFLTANNIEPEDLLLIKK